jgi:hypothetical protein
LDGNSPSRDLSLTFGSTTTGAGTVRFEGSNRLLLSAEVTLSVGLLDFASASSTAGTNTLTIAIGSTMRFDHTASVPGSIRVDGTLTLIGSPVTLTIIGTLTLDSTGVINNSDTIRAGSFVKTGGTINGNAPVVTGPLVELILIDRIQLDRAGTSLPNGSPAVAKPGTVTLTWRARPGTHFVIESSGSLRTWTTQASAIVHEINPGVFHGTVTLSGTKAGYYRLRVLPGAIPQQHSAD